ncbi:hypothetical protein BKA62DRAFT_610594 [Auriculariales sp. MPI-PUGE-AT-0066]|nr:hypothetical protein BKA62DRAFT_610594 [Auriculariales sp. MPI-PUGE-AT-0066]
MTELLQLIDIDNAQRREAAIALPHAFDKCTYALGSLRQAVYLCLTCGLDRGVCSACSIACHADHEQVELFPKRGFQCDCPTRAMAQPCSLVKGVDMPPNLSNVYGPNYRNVFCRCGEPYDAKTERETMVQCLACEDWFHESCLNLRKRVPPATGTTPPPPERALSEELDTPEAEAADGEPEDDLTSCASDPDLPHALLGRDDYDALICGACAHKMPEIQRYAGTPNLLLIVRPDSSLDWAILGARVHQPDAEAAATATEPPESPPATEPVASSSGSSTAMNEEPVTKHNGKRLASPVEDEPREVKRMRLDGDETCRVPIPSATVLAAFAETKPLEEDGTSQDRPLVQSVGDIFLVEGWRDDLCRCTKCKPFFDLHPYLLELEETYEPPSDPDLGLSIEELGLRALNGLPHTTAIEGARLFNVLRDDLTSFLRPFAQDGRLVGEADIRGFFDEKRDQLRSHIDSMRG